MNPVCPLDRYHRQTPRRWQESWTSLPVLTLLLLAVIGVLGHVWDPNFPHLPLGPMAVWEAMALMGVLAAWMGWNHHRYKACRANEYRVYLQTVHPDALCAALASGQLDADSVPWVLRTLEDNARGVCGARHSPWRSAQPPPAVLQE